MRPHRVFKGKLAHTFNSYVSIRNYHIVLFVGKTKGYEEQTFDNFILKALDEAECKKDHISVFRREFPLCDVAQVLVWDTLIFSKGITV